MGNTTRSLNTSLSGSVARVERSVFHAIRRHLVAKGYVPDVRETIAVVISSINLPFNQMTLTGDYTSELTQGLTLTITGSTDNDGTYTLASDSSPNSGDTDITLVESLTSAINDGQVNVSKYSDNDYGVALYETDLSTIVTNKGFAVEVFNNSSPQAKGLKKVPRIVIVPNNAFPGAIGGSPTRVYTPLGIDPLAPTGFTAGMTAPQTKDFQLDIHMLSNTAEQDRFMEELVALAVPARGYIETWDVDTEHYFVVQTAFRPIPNTIEGIIEKVYIYEVRDIFEVECVIYDSSVPVLEQYSIEFWDLDTSLPMGESFTVERDGVGFWVVDDDNIVQ